ncbi:5679_t:CDS:2 [Funneliformis mosseae]|uniref:5679_t:CDS:1 n=1 Tax=Funneliformis mosseae TaxID=27381 RepID=A0A9N8VDS5_FUNMO|nr:5679_t:CDS:2 [Funneliformis mosseae]
MFSSPQLSKQSPNNKLFLTLMLILGYDMMVGVFIGDGIQDLDYLAVSAHQYIHRGNVSKYDWQIEALWAIHEY